MRRELCALGLLALLVPLRAAPAPPGADPADAAALQVESFEKKVRPLLVESCVECHGPARQKGGLRLDSRQGLLAGGDRGPVVVPGDPARSRLLTAVSYGDVELQMPPRGKLPDDAVVQLEAWIRAGAVWPETPGAVESSAPSALPGIDIEGRKRGHWAWGALRDPGVPPVHDASWSNDPIDRFVLARLEAAQLAPGEDAGRPALATRLAYDLAGMAFSPAELSAFLSGEDPADYERLVDRALASPRFGERWARKWLDLVRYSETLGHEFDYAVPNAWRYRDYLIRALNADVPYDDLLREHVAGDLIPEPRRGPDGENESIQGTAFYWFGQQTHSPVDQRVQTADRIDNQIDVLTKTFLGLTVACARCHDHKFDPVPTSDYYAFYGFLSSSRYTQAHVDPPGRIQDRARRLAQLRETLEGCIAPRPPGAAAGGAGAAAPGPALRPEDVVVARFGEDLCGWYADGPAFASGAAPDGAVAFLPGEGGVTQLTLRGGWAHSATLSTRLQGALRSPTFTLEKRYVHALVAGVSSRVNLVVDGFTLIRDPIYGTLKRKLGNPAPHWQTIDVKMWQGRRAYLELSDLAPNDLADDTQYGPAGWIAASCVLLSDRPDPPGDPAAWARLERGSPVWAAGKEAEARPVVEELLATEASIPEPTLVPALADGSGEDEPVFLRGSPRSPGPLAPRKFLTAISPSERLGTPRSSGRLELAEHLCAPSNPFFARVIVNRVWHHLFGRGLVPTVDDFGVLGQPPSHPELLDWLASRFLEDGCSLKRLIRRIVLTRTYRLSSLPGATGLETRDADLALLHRRALRRVDGETLRDRILQISQGLDLKMGGPPVPIHLTPFMDGRGRPGASGPEDGARRRSIYLEVRRNFLSPFFLSFDTPLPATTVGRRSVSNVPAQALFLLNDPFVRHQAEIWARRVLEWPGRSTGDRVEEMYRDALGRSATADEIRAAEEFLKDAGGELGVPAAEAERRPEVWSELCHVVFNLKEFLFVP